MVPKVDTFEGDISEEIKRKEASATEISAASNNVGNDEVILPKRKPVFLISVIVFFVLGLVGFGSLAYFYFNDSILSPTKQDTSINPSDVPKNIAEMKNVSPTLASAIGRFVTRVEKKEQGYIITINDYSSVFAYMTRNESTYLGELSLLFSPQKTIQNNVPQASSSLQIKNATTTISSSTQKIALATTTAKISTSTLSTTTPILVPEQDLLESNFYDVTISNQNMRILIDGNNTIVYAFVDNTTVLISNSKEGILALKGAIVH